MKILIARNLKLFFRDHTAVFFSLLSVFITIALYVLFLANSFMSEDGLGALEGGEEIMKLWLLGGLMSVGAITTTLAAYETMVSDRVEGKQKDFFVSAMPRHHLAASYILSAVMIGFVMVSITLFGAIVLFYVQDGIVLGWDQVVLSLIISLVNVSVCAVLFFPLIQALKTRSAFSNFSVLMGTLSGFLMGVYVPIGILPTFAQGVIKLFPITHGCALLRYLLTHDRLQAALSMEEIVNQVEEEMGTILTLGDHMMSRPEHMAVLMGSLIGFGLLSTWCYRRHK